MNKLATKIQSVFLTFEVCILHLSIVSPTIPGALDGEVWGFDQASDQISHHLDRSGDQTPS